MVSWTFEKKNISHHIATPRIFPPQPPTPVPWKVEESDPDVGRPPPRPTKTSSLPQRPVPSAGYRRITWEKSVVNLDFIHHNQKILENLEVFSTFVFVRVVRYSSSIQFCLSWKIYPIQDATWKKWFVVFRNLGIHPPTKDAMLVYQRVMVPLFLKKIHGFSGKCLLHLKGNDPIGDRYTHFSLNHV